MRLNYLHSCCQWRAGVEKFWACGCHIYPAQGICTILLPVDRPCPAWNRSICKIYYIDNHAIHAQCTLNLRLVSSAGFVFLVSDISDGDSTCSPASASWVFLRQHGNTSRQAFQTFSLSACSFFTPDSALLAIFLWFWYQIYGKSTV